MMRNNKQIHPVSLLLISSIVFQLNCHAVHAAFSSRLEDSTRVRELLILDTLGLQISGPSSDVSFYENGMVFLSNTKYHQKMIPDHISFGVVKAYFVPLDYVALESSRPLFPNDDFPYSPAGMSFTRDYRTVYFTKPEELAGRRTVEKIIEMPIIDGKASPYQQLPFTTDPSRYLHPAISQNDSIMIFASDRSPSSGGLDLFVTKRTPNGWTSPANMGREINTSGHEWYPFLDHNNNLYFSSSGHRGYGGYDVYVCFFDGTGWSNPQNLSEFINTPGDEVGFSIHPGNKLAVFTRIMSTGSKGDVLKMSLNEGAFPRSGTPDPRSKDISLLVRDLTGSGYTSGQFQAATPQTGPRAFNLEAMPLLIVGEEADKQVFDQMTLKTETQQDQAGSRRKLDAPVTSQNMEDTETGALPESAATETGSASSEPEKIEDKDPQRLNFRVQILSSTKPNSRPQVTVDGKSYPTFEYYFKGAYRITVGEFPTVQEANAFRARCKSSGFNQSFVAAFRGEERETDPSVFRR
jgi:hypothetical protein